jgi:hypothetical protein
VRIAAWYGWYDENRWKNNAPKSEPLLGRYDSRDRDTIRAQIAMMQWCGIEGAMVSWWGRDTVSDEALSAFLEMAAPNFPVHVLYEKDIDDHPGEYMADLGHLKEIVYTYEGVRCLFAYKTWDSRVAKMAKQWAGDDWHVVTQSPGGDSQFVYNPGVEFAYVPGQCFSISAGFHHQQEPKPRLERLSPERYEQWARWALATQAAGWPWQIVYSNEYSEGTAIEPADPYWGAYMQALRRAWVKGVK